MKSKDISKYNLAWQVVRVEARDFASVSEKLEHVQNFLDAHANKQNFERVLNWAEGLKRGYKRSNEFAYMVCENYIHELKAVEGCYQSGVDTQVQLSEYTSAQLHKLYNDLKKRSLKWLSGGYIHKEQEDFIDSLAHELQARGVYVNHNQLLEARATAKLMPKELKQSTFFF